MPYKTNHNIQNDSLETFWLNKAGFTTMPSDEQVMEISQAADKILERLSYIALGGKPIAVSSTVNLAAKLVNIVSSLACEHPKLVDEIAKDRTSWPINCSHHPEMLSRSLRWLSVLPLGEKSGWRRARPGKKPPSLIYKSNGVISLLIQQIVMQRALLSTLPKAKLTPAEMSVLNLPDLRTSKENANLWFEVVWNQIIERCGGKPEKDARLREFGVSQGEAKARRLSAPKGKPSYESNVRQGIKDCLKNAFFRVMDVPKI